MSDQSAIAESGDNLFGTGPEAALRAVSKTFELAFLKAISQVSSPSADVIADQSGHIGVCREVANYKVASALSQALAQSAAAQTDPHSQLVLETLSGELADYATAAGQRIISAAGPSQGV